jgi:hypothetical protein
MDTENVDKSNQTKQSSATKSRVFGSETANVIDLSKPPSPTSDSVS